MTRERMAESTETNPQQTINQASLPTGESKNAVQPLSSALVVEPALPVATTDTVSSLDMMRGLGRIDSYSPPTDQIPEQPKWQSDQKDNPTWQDDTESYPRMHMNPGASNPDSGDRSLLAFTRGLDGPALEVHVEEKLQEWEEGNLFASDKYGELVTLASSSMTNYDAESATKVRPATKNRLASKIQTRILMGRIAHAMEDEEHLGIGEAGKAFGQFGFDKGRNFDILWREKFNTPENLFEEALDVMTHADEVGVGAYFRERPLRNQQTGHVLYHQYDDPNNPNEPVFIPQYAPTSLHEQLRSQYIDRYVGVGGGLNETTRSIIAGIKVTETFLKDVLFATYATSPVDHYTYIGEHGEVVTEQQYASGTTVQLVPLLDRRGNPTTILIPKRRILAENIYDITDLFLQATDQDDSTGPQKYTQNEFVADLYDLIYSNVPFDFAKYGLDNKSFNRLANRAMFQQVIDRIKPYQVDKIPWIMIDKNTRRPQVDGRGRVKTEKRVVTDPDIVFNYAGIDPTGNMKKYLYDANSFKAEQRGEAAGARHGARNWLVPFHIFMGFRDWRAAFEYGLNSPEPDYHKPATGPQYGKLLEGAAALRGAWTNFMYDPMPWPTGHGAKVTAKDILSRVEAIMKENRGLIKQIGPAIDQHANRWALTLGLNYANGEAPERIDNKGEFSHLPRISWDGLTTLIKDGSITSYLTADSKRAVMSAVGTGPWRNFLGALGTALFASVGPAARVIGTTASRTAAEDISGK